MKSSYLIKYSSILVLLVFILFGCIQENDVEPQLKEYDTFFVSINTDDTKVRIEDNGAVKWDIGDQIAVFSDIQEPSIFTREEDSKFRGPKICGNVFYSYPLYNNSDGGIIHYNPKNPTILDCNRLTGFFTSADARLPMFAKGSSNSLNFKQTGGIMHFRIKSCNKITEAYLQGNKGEHICGPGYIYTDADDYSLHLSDNEIWVNMRAILNGTPDDSEIWDLYFYLPPIKFTEGFILSIYGYNAVTGDSFEVNRSSHKETIVSRGGMISFPIIDVDDEYEIEASIVSEERDALIKLYHATDGDNWYNNTNWLSEKSLSQWYGVETSGGHITKLNLSVNHLCGELPQDVWSLPYLKDLKVNNNQLIIRIPEDENMISRTIELVDLSNYDLVGVVGEIANSVSDNNNVVEGGIPDSIEKMSKLAVFNSYNTNLSGSIPDAFWGPSLKKVMLSKNSLEGELSPKIANANCLEELVLSQNSFRGAIPDEICTLTNLRVLDLGNSTFYENCNSFINLPDNIGNLKNLESLSVLGNSLRGNLPPSLFSCTNLVSLSLGSALNQHDYYNYFDCELPEEIGNLVNLEWLQLYCTGIKGKLPQNFSQLKNLYYCDLTGEYDLTGQYSPNQLNGQLPDISGMENLEKLLLNSNYFEGNIPVHYADIPGLSLNAQYNCLSGELSEKILNANNFSNWLITPQRDGYCLTTNSLYESSDYSHDGNVIPLQIASEGEGINVVIMGDAFADYEIADGTYDRIMREGIEQFFAIEPYNSFRNRFNVYEVEVVSKNNCYLGTFQDTALKSFFGEGTFVGGDYDCCLDYASLAIGTGDEWEETLIIVLLNRQYYAGTCYMYHVLAHEGTGLDYGNGLSIAYLPLGTDDDMFRGLIQHEAGGHGFAKLADEYYYEAGGQFDTSFYNTTVELNWYPNIDFTSNPDEIKWKEFLNNSYYIDEGVGIYEGGATIPTGIWRPTENSIMRYNTGEYNAPSRQAIWKRINKLAYGDSWEFSHDGFVLYDQGTRSHNSPVKASKTPSSLLRRYPPLSPPVIQTVDKGVLKRTKTEKSFTQKNNSLNEAAEEKEYSYSIGDTHYVVKGGIVSSYIVCPYSISE